MSDQHFVVVGGSRGIGAGIVDRLVDRGANVTVISRTADPAVSRANVQHIAANVLTDPFPIESLPQSVNGLVYCPGSINLGPLRGLKPEGLMADFELNVVGAVKAIQACSTALKLESNGSIVLFSTVAVKQGMPMHASVAAAKGAIEGLTRSLAAELAPHVRVNCIAPSLTDTPLAARLLSSEQKREAMASRHPMKRVGEIADIAAAADYLLGCESAWVTGQVLGVDGGMSSVRS